MGCALSCFYFEEFSTFLEWVVSQKSGSQFLLHYLDDFLFMGPSGSSQCFSLLSIFVDTCKEFGIPLAWEKTVLPTTCIDFLGITIDTVNREFRLPTEKVLKLTFLLESCIRKNKVLLKELQEPLFSYSVDC